MRDILVSRIMTTVPTAIGPDDTLEKARELLESGSIHHLPVVVDSKLVGIVSSSDILKGGYASDTSSTKIKQIMERDPVVLDSMANLRVAAVKLSTGGFHALPVIDPDRTLVGIVTSSDLIDHLLHQIPRNDGSIHPHEAAHTVTAQPSEKDISTVLEIAERERESKLGQVLLYYQERNKLLQKACRAAEIFLRSGEGEHEHSVLVKSLADVRGSNDARIA